MAKIEETLLKVRRRVWRYSSINLRQVNEHQKMADRVEKMAKVLQELLDEGIDVESLELATRRFISQGPLNIILSGKKLKEGYLPFLLLFRFLYLFD
jgi:hypothetical protein